MRIIHIENVEFVKNMCYYKNSIDKKKRCNYVRNER